MIIKKEITKCPLCNTRLVEKVAAPCDDCGGNDSELIDLKNKEHEYSEWEALPGFRLVLCDFCHADMNSYNPEVLGFNVTSDNFILIKEIDNPETEKDLCCPVCGHRSRFLKYIIEMRQKSNNQL